MKFTLTQHRQMLKNVRAYARERTERANRANEEAGRYRADAEFYAKQIAEAERRGLAGFDPDKFMKTRK